MSEQETIDPPGWGERRRRNGRFEGTKKSMKKTAASKIKKKKVGRSHWTDTHTHTNAVQ